MQSISTPDGRTLCVHEDGDPNGFPVLVHHGTPAVGRPLRAHVGARARAGHPPDRLRPPGLRRLDAAARAARSRTASRTSTRSPTRSASSASRPGASPAAARTCSRAPRSATSGSSPSRASPLSRRTTPTGSTGSTGMGEENHVEFGKVLEGEDALRAVPRARDRARCSPRRPTQLVAVMATLLGAEDRAVLTGAFAEYMLESRPRTGSRPASTAGSTTTSRSSQPWGFDARRDRRGRCCSCTASDDRFVPVSHGRWLAARIPGVEARIDDARRAPDAVRAPDARGQRLAAVAQLNGARQRGAAQGRSSPPPTARACSALVRRHGMRLGAGRFVAGETLDECVAVLRRLNEQGLYANTTLLGEGVLEPTQTEARRRRVPRRSSTASRPSELRANVALKLTHLGLEIDEELALRRTCARSSSAPPSVTASSASTWSSRSSSTRRCASTAGCARTGSTASAPCCSRTSTARPTTSRRCCRSRRTCGSSRAPTSSRESVAYPQQGRRRRRLRRAARTDARRRRPHRGRDARRALIEHAIRFAADTRHRHATASSSRCSTACARSSSSTSSAAATRCSSRRRTAPSGTRT